MIKKNKNIPKTSCYVNFGKSSTNLSVKNHQLHTKYRITSERETRRVKKGHILLETTDSLSWMSSIIFLNFISALFPRAQHGRLRHSSLHYAIHHIGHVKCTRTTYAVRSYLLQRFWRYSPLWNSHAEGLLSRTVNINLQYVLKHKRVHIEKMKEKKNQPNQNEFHLLFGLGR